MLWFHLSWSFTVLRGICHNMLLLQLGKQSTQLIIWVQIKRMKTLWGSKIFPITINFEYELINWAENIEPEKNCENAISINTRMSHFASYISNDIYWIKAEWQILQEQSFQTFPWTVTLRFLVMMTAVTVVCQEVPLGCQILVWMLNQMLTGIHLGHFAIKGLCHIPYLMTRQALLVHQWVKELHPIAAWKTAHTSTSTCWINPAFHKMLQIIAKIVTSAQEVLEMAEKIPATSAKKPLTIYWLMNCPLLSEGTLQRIWRNLASFCMVNQHTVSKWKLWLYCELLSVSIVLLWLLTYLLILWINYYYYESCFYAFPSLTSIEWTVYTTWWK